MPICHHNAPNGEKSILYQQLENKYGEQQAHDVWTAVYSQQFLNKHGYWTKGRVSSDLLDNNGEPRLDWIEKQLGLVPKTSTVKSVFKPANKEQSDAITSIQDFIRTGSSDQYFTLEGKAGTGKTTIVQEAIAPFIEQKKSVLIAALSHKAKLVLATKLEDRFGPDAIVSKSIAGALAMSMDLETGDFTAEFGQSYVVPPVAKADIIIVDEASMVNEEALSLIMDKKKAGSKVIFLGDIGQLPPIRKKGDENEGKPSPVFGTQDNKAKLLTRVRQGEESPILPYADLFWNNSQSKNPVENPAKDANRKDIVNDKGALVFASDVNSVLPKVLPLYKEGIETNQPNLVKIVLYRNAPRIAVNNAVRDYIFGNDAKTKFLPKDLLIFTDNFTPDFMEEPISNSTEFQVSSAERSIDPKTKLKTWVIEFAYEGSPVTVTTLDPSEATKHAAVISQMFADAKAMPKGSARNAALQAAWAEKKRFAPIDYAYAITSHKSQGSTYNTVVVDENDIMNVGPIGAKEKSQSIYTALTRASTTTIVVDGQKTNQENLDKAITLSQAKKGTIPINPPVTANKQEVSSAIAEVPSQPIEGTKIEPVSQSAITAPSDFTNHSGGAKGGDMTWDAAGRQAGITKHIHYTVDYYDKLSTAEKAEFDKQYKAAANFLGRGLIAAETYPGRLVRRDMIQANNGDAIFGITELVKPGVKGRKGYQNKMPYSIPEGGTGYALARGILLNKPVYVFNQNDDYGNPMGWHKWDGKDFVKVDSPTLTKNFTGIGTQELNDIGKKAIEDIYKKTLAEGAFEVPKPVETVSAAGPIATPIAAPKPKIDTSKMKVVPVTIQGDGTKIDEEVMMGKVANLYNTAIANPNNLYTVPFKKGNPKFRYDNGYTAQELADMFDQQTIPTNVQFDPSFQGLIDNSARRIQREYAGSQPILINRNEQAIQTELDRVLVPRLNDDGSISKEGYFTPEQHKEIVDALIFGLMDKWKKDPALKNKAIVQLFDGMQHAARKIADSNPVRATVLKHIVNSRMRLIEDLIRALGNYGYNITDESKPKLFNAVKNYAELSELDKQAASSDGTIANVQETTDENGEVVIAEGHALQDYSDSTFELDPKDTASGRMKMFIATLTEVDRSLQPIKNFFGLPKLVDFEQTFEDALMLLADHPTNTFADMLATLRESGKPNMINLANQLGTQDQQMQNEFVKVMSKQYQQFGLMMFDRKKGKDGRDTFSFRLQNSNRYSQFKTIINNWKQNQKLSEIMVTDATGARVLDVKRAQEKWIPWLDQVRNLTTFSGDATTKIKSYMKSVFRVNGMDFTDEMMDYLFENIEYITKGTKLAGGLRKQFSINVKGEPEGIFSAFILKAAGRTNSNDAPSDEEAVSQAEKNNPLYTEQSSMQLLAKVAARFTPKLYSATHKSSEGKNVWDYGQNTKLSHKLKYMLNNFGEFYDLMGTTDLNQLVKEKKDDPGYSLNWYLDQLKNDPASVQKIELFFLDGLKATYQKKGTTRTSMSDREQMLNSLAWFQNAGGDKGHFLSLTHSDKTTTPLFRNIPKRALKSHPNTLGFDEQGNVLPNAFIGDQQAPLYRIFKSEWNRVSKDEFDYGNPQYNKGHKLFYFFPEFNYDAMSKMVADKVITQKEMNLIWVNGKRDMTKVINNDRELKVINKILTLVTQRRVDSTIAQWEKAGLVSTDRFTHDTYMFDSTYVRKLSDRLGIRAGKDIVRAAAIEYSTNYFMFDTAMSQLFYGDPALAFKGKAGQSEMKQVSATMKEYAKRLAKDIAPGQDGNWTGNKMYNTLTLADVKPDETYLKNVSEKLGEAYKGVEATDAQEVTTVQEHLDVAHAYGTIPVKEYQEMSKIIADAKGGYYEFTRPEHMKFIMQPMKPVYAGTRSEVNNGALLEDYVKTSSFPLYPPVTAGTEMEGLRNLMEKNNIQRAAYVSGKKMGIPNQPLEVFDKQGKFTNPNDAQWKAAYQQLSRDGFRIQQEVPYDEEKEKIKIVSQMNKLINEGIAHIDGFQIGDKSLSGKEVRALKEDIRKSMVAKNHKEFLQKLGVQKRDGHYVMPNKGKVYEILSEEARKKGYSVNELQGLLTVDSKGELEIPLMFNTAADRFESLLMSMVKKITEIKMPGKSYVQASGMGLTFKQEGNINKSKVVWMDGYDGSALKTLRIEDGTVKPAQVLAPFNFFDNDGNKLNVEDFMTVVDGRRMLDTSRVPKELVQLVGARIPNQGHNSMLPIEIVGFLPANMGDLIVVPAAITKQMGADFDVDKLYTYKRPYYMNEDGAFETYPSDSEKEGLQTQYFDVHWSVLTHKDMVEKVLNPLDKPDLEDENKILGKENETVDYYDHLNQLQDFQSGKDAKTLVGSTSLSVTFNSVIQDKNLHLYQQTDEGPERDFVVVMGEDGTELKLTNLSGYGTSTYDGEIRTKHDNLTTMQSAAVDNAKNRTLDNLNLTTNTYKAAAAFVQLETEDGKAINLRYVTRLLTQPIIKDFDALMKQGNDSLSEEFQKDLKASVIKQLEEKYKDSVDHSLGITTEAELNDKGQLLTSSRRETTPFTPKMLLEMQKNGTNQIEALKLFVQLDTIGQRLTELQSLANGDTNGAGANLLSSIDKEEKMTTIEQEPIANAMDIFSGTEQGTIFSATTSTANGILTKILPYDTLKPVFDRIQALSGKIRLNNDQRRAIIRSLRSYTYTTGEHWWTDAQSDRVRLFYNSGTNKSLAQRLMVAKRAWGKNNYFLQRLEPVIGNTTSAADFISYQAATVGTIDEEQNHEAWVSMLMSQVPEQRELAEDLLRYAFLTGGVQDANSFVKFVPVSYIAGTSFGDMLKAREQALREIKEDDLQQDTTYEGFAKQYLQHNPDMAVQVGKSVFGTLDAEQDYPESFKVPDSDDANFPVILKAGDGTMLNFFSYRSKAEGNTYKLFQKQVIGESVYYTRIDTLGNQYSDEYNGNETTAIRSIFSENRSMAETITALDNDSMGEFEDTGDHVSQIGIREGTTYTDALGFIKDNIELPEYTKTTAKILLTTNSDALISNAKYALKLFTRKTDKIKLTDLQGSKGRFNMVKGVQLDPSKITSKQDAAETILHELTHERLQVIIQAFGFDPRVMNQIAAMSEDEKAIYLRGINDIIEQHPEVVKSLEALDRIRYEAYNHLQNGLARDSKKLQYAFGSLQELVAHVLEGDETVVNYLNDVQSSQGETLLSRIWNLFTELLEAFAKSMGMKVNEGSLLKEALAHTLKLSTMNVSSDVNITTALTYGTSLTVPSQSEANELKTLGQETYRRVTKTSTNGIEWAVNFSNDKTDVKVSKGTQVDRVLEKLNQQIREAGTAMNHGTRKEIIAAKIRYRELKEDRDQLQREKNIDLIDTIGKKQLKWVDKILTTDHPLAVDVLNAQRTVDIWSNLTELLYDGTTTSTDPRFAEINEAGIQKRMKLMQTKAREVVVDNLAPRNVHLGAMDFKEKLEDLDVASATFISLARVKSKLYQSVAIMGKQSANNRDEEIGRNRDKLAELEARMKKAAVRPDMFIQDDNWGLVSRLSGKWHNHLSTLKKSRDESISMASKAEKMTDAVRAKKKSDVWNKYWNEIKKVSVFVDTRLFFDTNTGELLSGTDKHLAKLVEKVGSEEYAKELLEQAQEKYKSYLEEKAIAQEVINSKDLTAEQKHDEFEKWKGYNSPKEFLDKMTGKDEVKYVNSGDEWLVMVPKKEGAEFYDQKYTDIQNHSNKEVPKIYEEYKALLTEMKSYLPLTEQEELSEDFLPIISKETVLSLSSLIGAIKNWDEKAMDSLTGTEQEEMWRLKGDEIPTLYTRSTKKTAEVEDRSTDLIRLLEVFSMMALHHKHLAPVEAAINVAQNIIKDVNREKVNNNEKGLRNAMDSVKYFVDKLVYKKPGELEGRIDMPIYSINPVKQMKVHGQIKELTIEKEKLNAAKDAKMDEGDFDTEEEQKKIEKIDEKLSKLEEDARFLYGSKMVDTLVSVNQMKALSYNPFSALSNFTFGLISVSIHANARTDYNSEDMRWAMGKMMHSTKKYYSLGTAEDNEAIKIQNLMDRVGMLGDIVDTEYGKSNLGTRKDSAAVNAIKPYNWQRSGDYFAKGAMMLAMLRHKQVETSQGTKSLWEVLDNRGLWDVAKYGESPSWFSDNVAEQHEWNRYRDRIRQVGIMVFGNQDKNSPLMAKKHALLRLAGQFRLSWFSEGIATRWMEERDDQTLGRKVKGRWRTYGSLGIGTSGLVLLKQLLSSLPGIQVDAFKGVTDKTGKAITELDIENMRKNFAGLAWTMAIGASMLMIYGLAMDDDKKGKKRTAAQKRWQLLYNMVLRNHQDLMLYSSPGVLNTVTGNLLPATAVLTDAYKAMKGVYHYFGNTEEKDAGYKAFKKVARAIPILNLVPKTDYMINRSLDDIGN